MELKHTLTRKPIIRQILRYPNPTLNKSSTPIVTDIASDQELQDFMDDMVATMCSYRGVGLAAVQVGVPIRVLVVQDEKQEPIKVINPTIIDIDGESWRSEGCLSFPGLYLRINRPEEVTISYFNEKGELKTTINNGLLGRAIHHEMDHLNGLTFLDAVSKVERSIALEKWKKISRKLS